MFGSQNVYCTVSAFAGVRVKDEREQDRNHLVEVRFECPLTPELAEEIQPALVRDLFDKERGTHQPKAELGTVFINLSPGTQIMTVRPHPDLDPLARTQGVQIRKVRASKSDAGTWMLGWVANFPFDEAMIIGLMRALKSGVYITYERMDPALDFDNSDRGDVIDEGAEGEAPRGRGRGRGRGRRGPKLVQGNLADGGDGSGGDQPATE